MIIRLSLCLLLLCLRTAAADVTAAAAYPTEYWVSDKDGWSVKTAPCDSGLCAYLVTYKLKPTDPLDYKPLDEHNSDPKLRGRQVCGLMMMGGFHPATSKDATWDGGWIYDPDGGSTYSGKISLIDQNTVKVRGFLGISLFGRTLTLRRQAEMPGQCTTTPQKRPAAG